MGVEDTEERIPEQKDRIRLLVAALRSGQWKQGTGNLCAIPPESGPIEEFDATAQRIQQEGELCCLGVACEIAVADGVELERTADGEISRIHYRELATFNGSAEQLPSLVRDWFGLGFRDPLLLVPVQVVAQLPEDHYLHRRSPSDMHSASTLNDTCLLTFAEIADCFEYTYLRQDWDAREQS